MLLQKEMVKCVKEINEKELSKKENQIKQSFFPRKKDTGLL